MHKFTQNSVIITYSLIINLTHMVEYYLTFQIPELLYRTAAELDIFN